MKNHEKTKNSQSKLLVRSRVIRLIFPALLIVFGGLALFGVYVSYSYTSMMERIQKDDALSREVSMDEAKRLLDTCTVVGVAYNQYGDSSQSKDIWLGYFNGKPNVLSVDNNLMTELAPSIERAKRCENFSVTRDGKVIEQ